MEMGKNMSHSDQKSTNKVQTYDNNSRESKKWQKCVFILISLSYHKSQLSHELLMQFLD